MVAAIDWRTLALEPGSFVDEELAGQHTDLLFSAQAGERVLVYVLFEHQSTLDTSMPLRLLRYMVRSWTRHLESRPTRSLPLIVPALLAQVLGGWTAPPRFSAMSSAQAQELGKAVLPEFAYAVDDLHHTTDEGLRSRALGVEATAALWAMSDARDRAALLGHVGGWADLLEALARSTGGQDALASLLRYIASTSGDLQLAELRDIVGVRAPTAEAISMTIAEILQSQYFAKRRAEEQAEALAAMREMLFVLLAARDVPVDEVGRARVLACNCVETLKAWHDRATRAARLEDVFAEEGGGWCAALVSGDAERVETPEDVCAAGQASGVRWSILEVSRARRRWLTLEVRDRLAHCDRLKTLEHWLARAADAPIVEDIFELDAFASGTTLEEMLEESLIERQMWEAYSGELEGYADAVCTVLKATGLEVDADTRERVRRCRLRPQLMLWIRKAATATSVAEVFERGWWAGARVLVCGGVGGCWRLLLESSAGWTELWSQGAPFSPAGCMGPRGSSSKSIGGRTSAGSVAGPHVGCNRITIY